MKGISYIVASILMLIITIALAGTVYLYISGYFTSAIQGIELADIYCSKGEVTIRIKNIGTATIKNLDIIQTSPAFDILVKQFQGTIPPGESVTYTDLCEGEQSRTCTYRISPPAGKTITASIPCTDKPDYLVLALSFDEGSGTTTKDKSGHNNDGTLYGFSDNTVNWTTGKYGNALDFDGNDYIDLPNDLGYSTQVSAFAWFKHEGAPPGNYHIIFGGQELEISIPSSTGEIRTGVYTTSRYVSNHGSGLVDGNWHFVGFTFNGSTKRSYIDGAFVGEQSVSGSLTYSFSNRRIGRFGSSLTYYLNGTIDEVRIYNKTII